MNPELERRLKNYGAYVDAAADVAAQRRSTAPTGNAAAVADLDNVVVLAEQPHRFYRALAVAAAAVAVVAGGIAIVGGSSPSTSVGERPLPSQSAATPIDTSAVTTEAVDATPRPTTVLEPPPTQVAASATAPPPPTNQTVPPVCSSYTVRNDYHLEICDEGPAVRLVQERLKAAVDSSLIVDGYFGPGTRTAVRSFQQMHGLTVDGQVGPATWALLVPDAPGTDTDGNRIVDPSEITPG